MHNKNADDEMQWTYGKLQKGSAELAHVEVSFDVENQLCFWVHEAGDTASYKGPFETFEQAQARALAELERSARKEQ